MRESACVGSECRALTEWAKALTGDEETVSRSHLARRGTGDGTIGKMCGVNWGSSCDQPILNRRAKIREDEENKPTKGTRVSDEAIVSDDPARQHNSPESQGPLDERDQKEDPLNMPERATGIEMMVCDDI